MGRPMTGDRKTLILEILRAHLGPARAITAGHIAEMVFGDAKHDREVRSIIAELIVADGHGEILASCSGESFKGCPAGYFWADDWRQCEIYYNVLLSREDDIKHRRMAAWHARNRLAANPPGQPAML